MSSQITPVTTTPPADVDEPEGLLGGLRILEILDDLRKRAVYCAVAIVVGIGIALFFIGDIFRAWLGPLQALIPQGGKFASTEPTEPFIVQLQMAAIAGLVLGLPVVLWNLWKLASPALRRVERGHAVPFVVAATLLFLTGCVFSHLVVFPYAWQFLGGFTSDYLQFKPRIGPAFSLYFSMMLALGVIFQLPSFVFLLARMGLAKPGFLARNIKYAILTSFIASAIMTPTPDIATQLLLAGPMVALYIVSIGVAWLFQKH